MTDKEVVEVEAEWRDSLAENMRKIREDLEGIKKALLIVVEIGINLVAAEAAEKGDQP